MNEMYNGRERRKFLRLSYKKPLNYRVLSVPKDDNPVSPLVDGVSKNLSASGIYFLTDIKKMPKLNSVIAIDVDYKTATICREVEKQAVIKENKILAKVVHAEEKKDGSYGIGASFITRCIFKV